MHQISQSNTSVSARTIERLTRRSQFLYVRKGLTERRKFLLIQARRRGAALTEVTHAKPHDEEGPAHIGEGFTATKKIGNAVIRNRAKRRLRAGAGLLLPQIGVAGVDYVFIARAQTGSVEWPRLLDDMESALVSLRQEVIT